MNATQTLMLAAVSALSLGVGTAMARNASNGDSGVSYWAFSRRAAPLTETRVQAGSFDVETAKSGIIHFVPFNGDFSDLANPG